MSNVLTELQSILALLQANVTTALWFLSIFWIVFFVNILLGRRLNILGIYPRHLLGLPGIFFAPFLHANFAHLLFNSIPLFVFMDFLLILGLHKFLCVSLVIILGSGFGIWLLGRKAIHIGASALIMGYFSYLLVLAYKHPSLLTVLLAMIAIYYFGGLFLDLFPRQERVSWEGHVLGFLAGLAAIYFCNV